MNTFFLFVGIVVLAVTGVLEWYKALTKDKVRPSWVLPAISLACCLAAGILASLAGIFVEVLPEATVGAKIAGGVLVGLLALCCVELAYQLVLQLVFALIKMLTRGLNQLFPGTDTPADPAGATSILDQAKEALEGIASSESSSIHAFTSPQKQ